MRCRARSSSSASATCRSGLARSASTPGDRVAIVSESRPGVGDGRPGHPDRAARSRSRSTRRSPPVQARYILQDCGRQGGHRLHAIAAREDPGGPAPAAGARGRRRSWTAGPTARQPIGHLARRCRRARPRAADGRVGRRPGSSATGARRCGPSSSRRSSTRPGTTGEPKGVMLSHANLVSNLKAGAHVLQLSERGRGAVVPPAEPLVRAASVVVHLPARRASRWSLPSRSTRSRATSPRCGRRCSPACRGCTRSCTARIIEKGAGGAGLQAHDLQLGGRGRRAPAAAPTLRGRSVGLLGSLQASARRPPGVRQDPRGARRPRPLHGVGQRAAAGRHRGVLPRHRRCRSSKATA